MIDRTRSAYSEAIEFLYELRWFGAKLGLENTLRLAELADNPQRRLRFIHVAGTNGKGSTCAMLESIYRAAGYRVGLFTSPHLVTFRERMQVNRQLISSKDVVRLTGELRPLLKQFSGENHPTFFEAVTVMALKYFVEQRCDLVIWETGLGGRLDATNIVTPAVSVITNIHYDHQKWLGQTLASIAFEKAGIIKVGIPVVTGASASEALDVITHTAAEKAAPLWQAEDFDRISRLFGSPGLSLYGEHQQHNAAVALTTVKTLQPIWPVADSAVHQGLEQVHWPGRFQRLSLPNGRQLVLDGAHNLAGAQVLADSIRTAFPQKRPALILGVLQDKDWQGICQILAPLASHIVLVPVQNERTTPPEQLVDACKAAAHPATETVCSQTLAEALSLCVSSPLVVITGSLYLVGEAIEHLGITDESGANERGLNEWNITHSQV